MTAAGIAIAIVSFPRTYTLRIITAPYTRVTAVTYRRRPTAITAVIRAADVVRTFFAATCFGYTVTVSRGTTCYTAASAVV